MGANISSQISKSYQKSITDIMSNFQTDLTNAAGVVTGQDQKVRVAIINSKCANLTLNVSAETHIRSLAQLDAETITEITNDIYKSLETATTTACTQANEKLNLAQINISKMVSDAFDSAETSIVSEIETNISQMIKIDADDTQYIDLTIIDSDITNCTVNVDSMIDIINQQNFQATVKAFTSNADISELLNTFHLSTEQKNIGIDLAAIIGIIAAAVVAIIVVVIVIKLAAKKPKPKVKYRMNRKK